MAKLDIELDLACELLSKAAAGQLTFDDSFKAACHKACVVMRKAQSLAWAVMTKAEAESLAWAVMTKAEEKGE